MATISGTQGSWRVDLIVNETAIDINTNTSTASWELWIRRTDGGNFPMYGTPTVNIYVSGQRVYSASKYYSLGSITNSGVKLESGTVSNLPHNNSTGVINNNTASFTWTGSGFSPNNVSGSGTYQTAIIPRNSTITATSAYIGETSQLTITRYKEEYTHSIAYSFGSLSGYILANGTTTQTETKLTELNIGFPIPSTWYAEIPNNQEAICTLTVKTYNDDTQIGNNYTATFYIRVNPTTNKPEVVSNVIDINDDAYTLTGNRNILIKNYSIAEVSWTATPKNSATISNVKINDVSVTTSPHSFVLNSNTISIIATDSRGLSTTDNPVFTLKDYFTPSLTISSIYRANPTDNFATVQFNGTWFNENFGDEDNTLVLSWKYRETGTLNWTDGGNLVLNSDYKINNNNFWSGNGTSANEITIGGNLLLYEKNWDVLIIAADKITIYQAIGSITKGIPIINWEEDFFNVNGDIRQNDVSIFDKLSYSTNEIIVGKWIDDKPIYRKVLSGTTGNSAGEVVITHNISNLDKFIKIDGFTDENDQRIFPNFYRDFNSQYALIVYRANATEIIVAYGSSRTNLDFYLILEYTKTTDA